MTIAKRARRDKTWHTTFLRRLAAHPVARPTNKPLHPSILTRYVPPAHNVTFAEYHQANKRPGSETVRDVRDTLNAASWRAISSSRKVSALLEGRCRPTALADQAAYIDVSSDDDDEEQVPDTLNPYFTAIGAIPGTADLPFAVRLRVARKLARYAERLRRASRLGDTSDSLYLTRIPSSCQDPIPAISTVRNALYRSYALQYQHEMEKGTTFQQDVFLIYQLRQVMKETGIQLSCEVLNSLAWTYSDLEEISSDRTNLSAFSGMIDPEQRRALLRQLRARETKLLIKHMRCSNRDLARRLVASFGTARQSLTATKDDIGAILRGVEGENVQWVLNVMHGVNSEILECVMSVRRPWQCARVLEEWFGQLGDARAASFEEVVTFELDSADGFIELTLDERLACYDCLHEGWSEDRDKMRYLASVALFKVVCSVIGADDAAARTALLLEDACDGEENDVLKRLRTESVAVTKQRIPGVAIDQVRKVKSFAARFDL